MNKSQVIGGVICLLIAAFLTVAYFQMPPEKFLFLVGDNNIPVIPIGLAILGFLLLITAAWRKA